MINDDHFKTGQQIKSFYKFNPSKAEALFAFEIAFDWQVPIGRFQFSELPNFFSGLMSTCHISV